MRRTQFQRVARAALVLFCSATGWLITLTACSETTRYRVLSFFLDGVPDPHAPGVVVATGEREIVPETPVAELPKITRRYYAHTPYRNNRCAGCHSAETGQLLRSVEDGLCVTCHSQLVAGERFVHGPVAVNACTVCHHHHAAPFPNLLLVSPSATCLGCHEAEDLANSDYHATIDQQTCTDCHDPHGGQNRFFLHAEPGTP